MKNVYSIFLSALLLFGIFTVVLYTSCNKNSCKNINCLHNGYCVMGECRCPSGYTGERCETKIDLCKDVICQNGGKCLDGTCNCPTGYSGKNCEIKYDPCKNITCMNNATCIDGTCYCPDGFEGERCELQSRIKFTTGWLADDEAENGSQLGTYTLNVVPNGAILREVAIENMMNGQFTDFILAYIQKDTIAIPRQDPDNVGMWINGIGVYNIASKTVNLEYTITYPTGESVNFTSTWK